VRRIGVLLAGDETEQARTPVSAFTQALAGLGWTDGRNVRMDLRWPGTDINRRRALAQELVGLQSDIIVTGGTTVTRSRSSLREWAPIYDGCSFRGPRGENGRKGRNITGLHRATKERYGEY
jgi:putative ABC transport system substrate-binding protein